MGAPNDRLPVHWRGPIIIGAAILVWLPLLWWLA